MRSSIGFAIAIAAIFTQPSCAQDADKDSGALLQTMAKMPSCAVCY
jgi:hypothetical protein